VTGSHNGLTPADRQGSVKARLIAALEAERDAANWSSTQADLLAWLYARGSGRLPYWVRYEAELRGIR
jgi:hypothetical protein